jgi:hypothetical protein
MTINQIITALDLPATEELAHQVIGVLEDHYVIIGPFVIVDPQWWAVFITEVLYYALPHQSRNCVSCAVYHKLRLPGCPATRTIAPQTAQVLVDACLSDQNTRARYQRGLVSHLTFQAILQSYDGTVDSEAGFGVLHVLGVAIAICDTTGAINFLPALIAQTICTEAIVMPDVSVHLSVSDVSGWDWFTAMLQCTNYVHGTDQDRAQNGECIITTPDLFYVRYSVGTVLVTVVQQQQSSDLEIMFSTLHPRGCYLGNVIPSVEGASHILGMTPSVRGWTPTCKECAASTPTWDQLVGKQYHCGRRR